jgi:hypothetical protein
MARGLGFWKFKIKSSIPLTELLELEAGEKLKLLNILACLSICGNKRVVYILMRIILICPYNHCGEGSAGL